MGLFKSIFDPDSKGIDWLDIFILYELLFGDEDRKRKDEEDDDDDDE